MRSSVCDLRLDVAGHNLQVRRIATPGDSDKLPIVLLHQGLGSITQWRSFPEMLAVACGRTVIAYDRLGHGRSDRVLLPRPADFLDIEARIVLPELLDKLAFGSVAVYGHSDGGTIALLLAAAFPDRAKAVVSEAAHVFSEVETRSGFAEIIAAYESGDLRSRLARHHGDNIDTMFRGWVDAWQSPAMRNWHMLDQLSAIRSPVLALQGDNDEHGSPAQIGAIVKGVSGPVESWFVPGCGHSPHLEATEAVVSRARAFFDRVLGVSGA